MAGGTYQTLQTCEITETRELPVPSSGDHHRILCSRSYSFSPGKMSPSTHPRRNWQDKEHIIILQKLEVTEMLMLEGELLVHNPPHQSAVNTLFKSMQGPQKHTNQIWVRLNFFGVYFLVQGEMATNKNIRFKVKRPAQSVQVWIKHDFSMMSFAHVESCRQGKVRRRAQISIFPLKKSRCNYFRVCTCVENSVK